ncbi:hypothetical protein H2200_003231 [Cladophialophora chaetospira]|uniref:Xylanolytic transcriptional activator regulatory domain-containing protein n=1 Tax=Cladophialophora chaetospira TaxID=386627 RepID=A0AA38XH15_9EURO|nr:hypothetical protein H2200_003231 [Cladophialophora chaetospira]
MVKFVDIASDGLPLKRKQVPRACQTCRKRKKRCPHVPVDDSGASVSPHTLEDSQHFGPTAPPVSDTCSASVAASSSAPLLTPLQPPTPTRPLSSPSSQTGVPWEEAHPRTQYGTIQNPLNIHSTTQPRSHFSPRPTVLGLGEDAHQALSESGQAITDEESHFIGHTNPQGIFLAATSPSASVASGGGDKIGFWMPRNAYEHVKTHRKQTFDRKSKTLYTQDRLVSNVLLPWVLDQSLRLVPDPDSFAALHIIYKADVYPIFPVIDFDMPSVASTIENPPSKILLMQAICLAAATSPKARPHLKLPSLSESVQIPKDFISYLSQAILTSFDLGTSKDKLIAAQAFCVLSLFSQLSNDHHSSAEYCARATSYVQTMQLHLDTSKFRKDDHVATRLFLCVWALDRLNAAFHGRPVLMHERDFGRDMASSVSQQNSSFQLFLVVVELLDKIIDLYRPSTATPDYWMDDFPSFEDIIIQTGSQRVPGYIIATVEVLYHAVAMLSCRFNSLDEPDRSSPASARQNFAASRVIFIVENEFVEDIALMPFVPYAVSLCLRVSYRELRLSKVPLLRARSRRQLLTICALLRRFNTFASADTMADLAEQTVREMDKVAASMISGRRQSITDSREPCDRAADEQPSLATTRGTTRTSARVPYNDTQSNNTSTSTRNVVVERVSPALDNRELSAFDFDLEFADLPDIDLFEHFDPGFKLPAIDAALAQNVDLSTFADLEPWSGADLTPPDGLSGLHSTTFPSLG